MILVGTKKDKEEEREVESTEALQLAKSLGMAYFEISSCQNKEEGGLNDLFEFAIEKCYKKFQYEKEEEKQGDETRDFKIKVTPKKNKGCFDWLNSIFNWFHYFISF